MTTDENQIWQNNNQVCHSRQVMSLTKTDHILHR